MTVSNPTVAQAHAEAPGSKKFVIPPDLRLAVLFTFLTLLGLIVGLIGEKVMGNDAVMWIGFGLAYLAGGIPAGREALHSLFVEKKLDVDLLMVLAALGAATIGQAADGAILLFLFSLSNTLQDWAMGRTKRAIEALMDLNPEGATVRRNGVEKWCQLGEIQIGDLLVIKPGERVAADARVVRGNTSVDESPITGESRPIDKAPGAELASGTVNLNGSVEAEVVRPAGDSTLARLVALMEDAQTQKSRTETLSERWESPYATLVLISVPLVYAGLHYLAGLNVDQSWYRAMTFMVVASPCAVVISTPAVMLSAMAAAARAGVLFKSSAALDALANVNTIAFDKTGTLTQAKMTLSHTYADNEREALALAAGLEAHSEHPIAQAIVQAAQAQGVRAVAVQDAQAIPGHGIEARLSSGDLAWAGNLRLAEREKAALTPAQQQALDTLSREGSSTVIVGVGPRVVGVMGVADALRPGISEAMREIRAAGVAHPVMLTGDKKEVAETVAKEVGLTEYRAELLPEDKLRIIGELPGPVAMVGDGVNDAPALARADLGVAVASGTDVAIESADVVLMQNDMSKLAGAVRLAKDANRTGRFNLLFAFGIILIVAPLAIMGRVPLPLGVVAHEGGTVFVVFMGLRLLRHRL
ncbi:heavy metal translocating P-type ATPase [Deinococcus radiodurans]|jgi:heavy metal-(Cd/Co/Hg/Pb/Zn)-translocating P-type ATPase|uniref:heavy metal translocating P-type ATPase n=2 Tax=Deinococcus radiodurans TaxID=1299 RepID=UPI00048324F8|nr:cation-translocating P-type ATPase [Deinococcus radiodurans]ANC71419.1 ATPase [Deinococcus radiodurans R1 = ATCC 13939 = DSM 20539]QIP29460.1 cation-translocating P-type ATPase [Deinococcus radiodurans]QIP31848.1 cation-translocating P-type ATPase [Deinococcus radiodurans]UID70421.1 ATPase [Deinococcus radiodurans R1 = ATCC 13939 = DSM 20539]